MHGNIYLLSFLKPFISLSLSFLLHYIEKYIIFHIRNLTFWTHYTRCKKMLDYLFYKFQNIDVLTLLEYNTKITKSYITTYADGHNWLLSLYMYNLRSAFNTCSLSKENHFQTKIWISCTNMYIIFFVCACCSSLDVDVCHNNIFVPLFCIPQ